MENKTMINTCPQCNEDHATETPLISTMAFNGYEYWCPFCGYQTGMMGYKNRITLTPVLEKKLLVYKIFSNEFLSATGSQVCSAREINGIRVSREDFTPEFLAQMNAIVEQGWKYYVDYWDFTETQVIYDYIAKIHNRCQYQIAKYVEWMISNQEDYNKLSKLSKEIDIFALVQTSEEATEAVKVINQAIKLIPQLGHGWSPDDESLELRN